MSTRDSVLLAPRFTSQYCGTAPLDAAQRVPVLPSLALAIELPAWTELAEAGSFRPTLVSVDVALTVIANVRVELVPCELVAVRLTELEPAVVGVPVIVPVVVLNVSPAGNVPVSP